MALRALTPRLSPLVRYPNAVPLANAAAVDPAAPMDAKSAPTGACKTAQTRFRTAPTASLLLLVLNYRNKTRRRAGIPTAVEIRSVLRDR